jgi:DNA-binding transcriptional MerR regulator
MSAALDMSKLPDWPRLMDRETAAAYLGVSVWQLDDWRREGLIPEYLPGTKRFDRSAIDRRLDELSGLRNAKQTGTWRA